MRAHGEVALTIRGSACQCQQLLRDPGRPRRAARPPARPWPSSPAAGEPPACSDLTAPGAWPVQLGVGYDDGGRGAASKRALGSGGRRWRADRARARRAGRTASSITGKAAGARHHQVGGRERVRERLDVGQQVVMRRREAELLEAMEQVVVVCAARWRAAPRGRGGPERLESRVVALSEPPNTSMRLTLAHPEARARGARAPRVPFPPAPGRPLTSGAGASSGNARNTRLASGAGAAAGWSPPGGACSAAAAAGG